MLEVGEEEAHLGCQPVSPRLHETLMDLIDWREHLGGFGGCAGYSAGRKNKSG